MWFKYTDNFVADDIFTALENDKLYANYGKHPAVGCVSKTAGTGW